MPWGENSHGPIRKSGTGRIIQTIDRTFINEAWLEKFQNWRYKAVAEAVNISDHSPLSGYLFVSQRPARAPFGIQKIWFSHSDFMSSTEFGMLF